MSGEVFSGRNRVRWMSWAAMVVVLVLAIAYSLGNDDGPPTNAERAAGLARTIACPQCDGQSVAESNAPIAITIAADIKERVDDGESDDAIRAFYIERYGERVNLKPSSEGFDVWVWVAPFLAIGAAAGGLGVGFARWRDRHPSAASADDVELVARAAAWDRDARREQRMATRLDPDALAALEDERSFLLSSIADLDAEFEAGDLSAEDHAGLRDDYTRRGAAEVIRAVDEDRWASDDTPRVTGRQALTWVVGLAVVGVLAGFAIARDSGTRLDGETASGSVRTSTLEKLNQARSLLGDQDAWDDAIELYDEVLAEQPSNVAALTYRGWLQYRSGAALDEVLPAWDQVIELDDTYPDARVFRTIAFADAADWDAAAAELAAFDALTPPAVLSGLIDQRGLRGEIVARTTMESIEADDRPTLDSLDLTVVEALMAADWLLVNGEEGSALAAVKLYDAVLATIPDEPEALLGKAFILGQNGLTDEALVLLDRFDALDQDAVPPELRGFASDLRNTIAP